MAARRQVPRASAKGRRKDPVLRPTDNTSIWGKLKNADPTKEYFMVPRDSPFFGVRRYESQGWSVCMTGEGPDALGLSGGVTSKPGEPIENFGLILMQREKSIGEEYARRGQEMADQIDDRMGRVAPTREPGHRQVGEGNRFESEGMEGEEIYPELSDVRSM